MAIPRFTIVGRLSFENLTLRDGIVSGSVNHAYIPTVRADSRYAKVVLGESGFEHSPSIAPLQLGSLDPDTVGSFKARIRGGCGAEGDLVHLLVLRPSNLIVDQEIAFQDPGETRFEKIDLCIFDKLVSAFSFVEVKTLSDPKAGPIIRKWGSPESNRAVK